MKIKSNINLNLIIETISNYTDCYTLESRGYNFYITYFDFFVRLVKHLSVESRALSNSFVREK